MATQLDIEDPDQLAAYLESQGWTPKADRLRFTNLHGGVSNRTVLVEGLDQGPWVMKQALARLRVAEEWLSDPVRIGREAAGITALNELLPPGSLPKLIFEDPAHHLLAMEAVQPPFEVWKERLLRGEIETELCDQFGTMLAQIHARSGASASRYAENFDDRSFFESLRLQPYYAAAAQKVESASDFLHSLIDGCRQVRSALVHGDYSPKNILVRQGRLILLDHEVIHWGDPAFDIGFGLTHLLSKANHMPQRRGDFLTGALVFWRSYRQGMGQTNLEDEFESRAVRHTLACLLARIDGRSPLEYLRPETRNLQRRMVLERIDDPAESVETLIRSWH